MKGHTAILYRMALQNHVCPYGLRAKDLLEEAGYDTEDRVLRTRAEVDAFQDEHDVSTTPQVFIDGSRIGGAEELERYLINEQSEA
jgi:glutaredoxin 3